MTVEEMRSLSGDVASDDILSTFFYYLLRDCSCSGSVEYVMNELEKLQPNTVCKYTNGWLAAYAMNLSTRFKAVLLRNEGVIT